MKRRYNLAHFLTLLVFIAIATTVASSFSIKLLQLSLLESVVLVITLLLMLLPISKRTLGDVNAATAPLSTATHTSSWSWLAQIIAIQCGFYLLQYAMAAAIIGDSNTFMLGIVSNLLYQGLHPWPLIGCLAVGIGTLGVAEKQPKVSGIVRTLFTKMPVPAFFSAFDIASTIGFIFWLMAITVLMLFQLTQTIHYFTGLPALTFGSYFNIYLCAVLAIVIMNKYFRSLVARRTSRSENLGSLLCYFFGCMSLVIIASLIIFNFLPSDLQITLGKKYYISLFVENNPRLAWLLLSWSVGICLAPTIAAWLSQISCGKSVRQVLAATIVLPLIVALIFNWLAKQQMQYGVQSSMILNTIDWLVLHAFAPLSLQVFPLFIFVGFLFVLTKNNSLNRALVQLTANQAGKTMRRYRKIFLSSRAFLVWFLLLFLYTGISGMQFLLTLAAILVVIFALPLPVVALLKQSLRKEAKQNSSSAYF